MDLSKLSITELKALWLDQLLIIENGQRGIQGIQLEIKNRATPKPEVSQVYGAPEKAKTDE